MADFCKQCSESIFGRDFEDLAHIAFDSTTVRALCEGCGPTVVDALGRCVAPFCPVHGARVPVDVH